MRVIRVCRILNLEKVVSNLRLKFFIDRDYANFSNGVVCSCLMHQLKAKDSTVSLDYSEDKPHVMLWKPTSPSELEVVFN